MAHIGYMKKINYLVLVLCKERLMRMLLGPTC